MSTGKHPPGKYTVLLTWRCLSATSEAVDSTALVTEPGSEDSTEDKGGFGLLDKCHPMHSKQSFQSYELYT